MSDVSLGFMDTKELPEHDLEKIRQDGICVKPQFFSDECVRELQKVVQRMREYSLSNSKEARRWILVSPIDVLRKSIKPRGFRDIKYLSDIASDCDFRSFAATYMSGQVHLDHILSIESPQSPQAITAWHTDANSEGLHENFFTLKFFIYLNDISGENGAFAYVRGSHRPVIKLRQGINRQLIPYFRTASPTDLLEACEQREVWAYLKRDISEDQIEELCRQLALLKDDQPGGASYDLSGLAGTLLIFDDRGIHRGGIPMAGPRSILRYSYALNEHNKMGHRRAFVNQVAKRLLVGSIRRNW